MQRYLRDTTLEAFSQVPPFPRVELIAHRGNAADFPENTIAALRSAIALGSQFLALDVQLSRDEIPVVIHDADLVRTTGRRGYVIDLAAEELLSTEACERSRFGNRFSDIRIPSLEQCTELLAAHPQVTAFIDIQRASIEHFGAAVAVARVSERIYPVRSQCVLISRDLPTVFCAKSVTGAAGWILDRVDAHERLKCEAVKPDFLFCDMVRVPRDSPRLWRGPWAWSVYGVEQVVDALALAQRGVSYIVTRSVRSMRAGLDRIALQAP